ncbi:MAG: YicC family protein [Defluviitaleaceae bacterium]|nr:YicC family protein [Defluviitaleaceae bacterium]
MIRSMTGYGKGIFENDTVKFSVEMKSLNNKYSEFNLRLPRLFNSFEERLRKVLTKEIARGRVDVYVNFEAVGENSNRIKYNKNLADSYHQALAALANDRTLYPDHNTLFTLVSRFPDVIEIDREFEEEEIERLWNGLEAAVQTALQNFVDMRKREGDTLAKDMLSRLDKITELTNIVQSKAQDVIENHRIKLKKRMEEALAGVAVDEARFLNEVAHFADKSDINEEITRLRSHLAQFKDILCEEGAVGRKLDFLTQEMSREANTMGSKANFAELSKVVIELKSEVEKVREQVQNIE